MRITRTPSRWRGRGALFAATVDGLSPRTQRNTRPTTADGGGGLLVRPQIALTPQNWADELQETAPRPQVDDQGRTKVERRIDNRESAAQRRINVMNNAAQT